ncbi:hypothetical protein EDB83DRAFT_2323625 [Lactarius deliciosus]|nr:hypothetical protein EDB83DRAFT_2323625 [Lactarius deliciosus]
MVAHQPTAATTTAVATATTTTTTTTTTTATTIATMTTATTATTTTATTATLRDPWRALAAHQPTATTTTAIATAMTTTTSMTRRCGGSPTDRIYVADHDNDCNDDYNGGNGDEYKFNCIVMTAVAVGPYEVVTGCEPAQDEPV